jgi:hypothetical protein
MAVVVLVLLPWVAVRADKSSDSTSRSTVNITPRLHSAGYFPFTGALLNHHPVADVNISYENKMFGAFLFQSVDMVDAHSYANYMQPGVFASLKVHRNLRVRTFFGYVFSQTQGFRDSDSDYYTGAQVNWGLSKNFRAENTLLYYDFSHSKKVANRLLLEWSSGKFRVSLYVWQRTVLDEPFNSTSAALALAFPIIKLSKKVSLEFTSSYMGYLCRTKPDFALQKGVFFTLALPFRY